MRLLFCTLLLVLAPEARAVDTIFFGGTIITLRGDQPSTVEALAIADGVVVAVGSREHVFALADENTRRFDLQGAFAIPGLTDAHAHLHNLGKALARVNLRHAASAEECVDRAREMEASLPDGAWLHGRGWDQNLWTDATFPDRALLDEAFGDRPVIFERVDGHASWVNSAALRLAGIDASTPDPEGGEIIRDAGGAPTGILVDEAEELLDDAVPDPGPAEMEQNYRRAIAEVHSHGLTGVHEMGVDVAELEVLAEGAREGWLDLRLVCYLGGATEMRRYAGKPLRPGPDARLWVDGAKFYADGALGSRGAALLEDYADRPGHQGLLIQSPDSLQALVQLALTRELTPVIHAIGDRGNRVALDALIGAHAALGTDRPLATWRPRIEHVQVVAPDDFARFAEHGIIASMQPTHCTSDMPWAPLRLGDERIEGAYQWRRFLDLGVQLPLGSDFPVEKPSPWLGIHAARTRHSTATGQTWSPDQCLTPLEALLGFTAWPAEAIGALGWGRLIEGFRADLVVVDRDPLDEDASLLLDLQVEMTVFDGEPVFIREGGRFDTPGQDSR